ncbi:MAG: polymorphic toxin-type HINT domain-containing protein [Flavobacteriaceae bacterium]
MRNDRRVWNEDTRRYNTLPEVPDGVPRADLPPDGSPQAVAWDDYVNGNSPVPCFPEGTLISTPNGKKPIETIAVNDMVWSFDHLAKKTRIGYVKGISKNHTLSLVHIHSKGHVLKATRNHPFWIEEEEKYCRADALTEGMFLRKMDGQLVKIDSIYIEEIETTTYNFEVSNYRNYFVGEDEVLVHNDDVVEAVASGLANTDTFPSRIYIIADPVTNQVIYVGQTIQTLDTRFGQHLTDPNSSIFQYLRDNGYPQLADNPDFLRGRNLDDLLTIETPINGNMMTHYELTVWEQFYIDNNGGIANLENKINAITPEKRLQYASFHNPCY